jgi:hypothetical protein
LSAPVDATRDALARASLIVPVGRDDERLQGLLAELEALGDLHGLEVIVVDNQPVDNQGTDASAPLSPGFARAALRHRVVRATTPGKGAAVSAGMLAATRELRVFTDVDLPYGFEGVKAVIAALAAGAVVAVGSRLAAAQAVRAPFLRRVMSFAFRKWVALCLGDLGDTQCGLKGFRADAARDLFPRLRTPGFAFDTELLARAKLAGHAIVAVPVTLRPAQRGTSSIHVFRDSYRMFRDVLTQRRFLRAERQAPGSGGVA